MPLNFASCSEFFRGFLHLVFQITCLNVSLQYKNNSSCLINLRLFVFDSVNEICSNVKRFSLLELTSQVLSSYLTVSDPPLKPVFL